MSHLVANNNADGSIVECLVSLGVEERILQYSCWETDFVGCRIVVSVDSLWGHEPLVFINVFAGLVLNLIVVLELSACLNIFEERFRRVDGQCRIVFPFVWITDFKVELIEFLMGVGFRLCAHPVLSINALA